MCYQLVLCLRVWSSNRCAPWPPGHGLTKFEHGAFHTSANASVCGVCQSLCNGVQLKPLLFHVKPMCFGTIMLAI